MSETKHTPGPWKVLTNLGNRRVAICTENAAPVQAVICEMDHRSVNVDYDGQISNARLIAAAPTMYAKLLELREVLADELAEVDPNWGLDGNPQIDEIDAILESVNPESD